VRTWKRILTLGGPRVANAGLADRWFSSREVLLEALSCWPNGKMCGVRTGKQYCHIICV
jgi:hypothetical protein